MQILIYPKENYIFKAKVIILQCVVYNIYFIKCITIVKNRWVN